MRMRTVLVILLYREGYNTEEICELLIMSNKDVVAITKQIQRRAIGEEPRPEDIDIPIRIMKKAKIPRI
jgi:hypothetical protein